MLEGSYTAIVTPFKAGQVDENAFKVLIDRQVKGNITGIVPCGTTGESPTLSFAEHKEVIDLTVKYVDKRVKVIAGAGSNSTKEAIELAKSATDSRADAILVITPYYNKPTQHGLYLHYKKIAEEVDIPIVLYNVPGRTGVDLEVETIAKLSKIPNIQAIKEASGSVTKVSKILSQCDITVLSGEDGLIYPIMAVGGKGVISVTSNLVPDMVSSMVKFGLNGQFKEALSIHNQLFSLSSKLFIETNPIPIKTALAELGLINEEFRLPLCQMTESNREIILEELNKFDQLRK